MTKPFDLIKQELPNVSSMAELQKIRDRIEALMGVPRHLLVPAQPGWLTKGIWTELARRGMVPKTLIPTMLAAAAPKAYRERCTIIQDHLIKLSGGKLNDIQQAALGAVCGTALARFLEHHPHFGLRDMLYNIDRVPEALEASFPGYLGAGLIGLLLGD